MKQETLRTTFFLALLGGVLLLVFRIMQPYLVTLAIAGTAAVVLFPLHKRLTKLLRGQDRISAMLMVLLAYLLLLLPLTILGIQIATEAAGVYNDLRSGSASLPTDVLQTVENLMTRYVPWTEINLSQYAGQGLNWIAGSLQSFFTGTVRAILLLFLGTIAYYYMLKDGRKFLDVIIDLSPLTKQEDEDLIKRLHMAVNSVIRGSLIIAILQGTVTGIGLTLFGIPSAALLGSIAGVGALIPTVGTTVVMAPVTIYLLITGDYFSGIGLTIWAILAVGMIDNFLHPLLVGRGMKMHPMFIFFAVMGGITYFGLSGFILGPLIMSLLFGLLDIFRTETA